MAKALLDCGFGARFRLRVVDTSSHTSRMLLSTVTRQDVVATIRAMLLLAGHIAACRRPCVVYLAATADSGIYRDMALGILARMLGCRLLVHLHGTRSSALFHGGRIHQTVVRLLAMMAECVVSPTQADLDGLLRGYGFHGRAELVRNWAAAPVQWRVRDYGAASSSEAFRFVAVGRVCELKGTWDALAAVHRLLEDGEDVRLTWIGPLASDGDGLKAERMVTEWGLDSHVTFVGAVTDREKYRIMAESDAFLLPSHSEGFPLAILEAMACGLPVLSSTAGGIAEVIEPVGCGLLCRPSDLCGLVQNMRSVMLDPGLRALMGERAHRHYWTNLSAEAACVRLESLIESCVEDSGATGG